MDPEIKRATEFYETKFKVALEPAQKGKFVAIDVACEEYFLGDEVLDAHQKASEAHPGHSLVILRVGYPAARFIGSR